MGCGARGERRQTPNLGGAETRGVIWSLPGGQRLPNLLDVEPLVVGDVSHPARLRPSDLEDPQTFHARLTTWILQQGCCRGGLPGPFPFAQHSLGMQPGNEIRQSGFGDQKGDGDGAAAG